MEVHISADGALTEVDRLELAHLLQADDGRQVVLRGFLPDQAALMGTLARLRRAGVHIRDVECGPAMSFGPGVVAAITVESPGCAMHVDLALSGEKLVTPPAMALEVWLPEDSHALLELLERLEGLGITLRSVHIREVER